ncbi:MAG: AMP-binding protein [Bacteroidia bacterium]|nr:AMP-binding protein [Bacteroidia bacterium]
MSIRIFNKLYLPDELLHLKQHTLGLLQDEDERAAVLFLHEWLSGKTFFEQPTSGSTGAPKVISISREQMLLSAKLTGDFLHFDALHTALLPVSARYIGGKMLLVRALLYQMDIEVVKPSADFLTKLDAFHPYQLVSVVPSQLAVVKTDKRACEALQQFKTVLVGGAPLPHSLNTTLQQITGAAIWQTYGMTETVSHIALRKMNGENHSMFYHPLPGVELKTDERNCLCIKAAVTGNEWITTNDVVELHHENFTLTGRWDEVINSGGIKIFPSQIEQAADEVLNEMNLSYAAFAGALPDEKLGSKLVLVLQGREPDEEKLEALKQRMKAVLPAYHAPARYLFVEKFPLLPSGKINKVSVLQSFLKDS